MRVILNLLSPEKKTVLRTGFIFAYVQTMLFIVFLVIAFSAGTLLAVRMMLKGTYEDLARRSNGGTDETTVITDDIKKINDYLQRIDSLEGRYVPWSNVMEDLTRLVPPGAQLSSMHLERTGKITLSGVAARRDDVLTLQTRLNESPSYKDVKAPLSNILQQKDVKFEFEFSYVAPAAQ